MRSAKSKDLHIFSVVYNLCSLYLETSLCLLKENIVFILHDNGADRDKL